MPSVTLYPRSNSEPCPNLHNPLPHLLQTPSGLAILELQGTINVPDSIDTANNGQTGSDTSHLVGRLSFPDYREDDPSDSQAWMKRVYFHIGHYQRLTGEVKKLAKPMAVVRQKAASGTATSTDTEELEIAEIVYYKILFSSRPEPVTS